MAIQSISPKMDRRAALAMTVVSLAAAFLNLIPLLLVVPAGDAIMNIMQVDCFSKQLWQGIFYPRWCVDANGGMGSSGPIFYFPLPFYVTALFAPLQTFGLTVGAQYLIGIYLANVTAFICCTAWLSRIVSRRTAYFCAFLFLFGFYRAEMMSRASYAEYWCVALLPLLFMYVREACHARFRNWPKLALVIAVCLFCHAPVTLIGLMAAGLFILLYGRGNRGALLELAIASLLAAMIALFHYLPMKLLVGTLNDQVGGPSHWRRSWVNSFVDMPQLYIDHGWALIGSGVGLVAALFILASVWRSRSSLPEDARREAVAWIAIAAFALGMMFSPSKPLWSVVEMISGIATPWRMQALVLLAMMCCFAMLAEHVWFQKPKTRTGDKLLCVLFFVFSSLFYAGGVAKDSLDVHARLMPSQYTVIYFSTRDMDNRYKSADTFFHDFIDRPNRRQAEWVKGGGALKVEQWDARGLIISGHADKAGTLRLEHFYHPIWQATLAETPLPVAAEPVGGRMLLEIPQGNFRLQLTQHYLALMPDDFRWSWASCLLALAIIGWGFAPRNTGRSRP
ncbi:MAG: hypothetical protein SFX19_04825 [Alphaproteobacteria bacterium]|nr:hypothetical protein [Alphaproteobacteria bacterium]